MQDRIEVYYCTPGWDNKSYASGSIRMSSDELYVWLKDQLNHDKPVLITGIKVLATPMPQGHVK